jgi:hypothetical protein
MRVSEWCGGACLERAGLLRERREGEGEHDFLVAWIGVGCHVVSTQRPVRLMACELAIAFEGGGTAVMRTAAAT